MRPQRKLVSEPLVALSPVLRALRSHPALLRNRVRIAEVVSSLLLANLFFNQLERCVVVRVGKGAWDLAKRISVIISKLMTFVRSQQWF